MTSLLDRATAFQADLVDMRRDLHRHPELSFTEVRTAGVAAAAVERLGFRVRTGVGRTGVVAEIGADGPVVALRADMDALPILEASDADYCSTVPGVMHACGHDAHVSMLVGAARLLAERHAQQPLGGTVRLLFQPSEEASDDEGKSGATRMIDDGAMDGVDAVFGMHIGAHLPFGHAHISPGPIMAGSDLFTATVHGRSSHAGRPHEGTDAIVLAAHAILACQMGTARRISPHDEGTLAIGTIRGGFAENVLAESVSMRGTIRYFEEAVRTVLHDALQRGLRVAETLGGSFEIAVKEGYPPVVNDDATTALAMHAVGETLGVESIVPFDRMMGAEDFAILAREAPGCFFWLGAALDPAREHHHPAFDIDERALPLGAAAMAACALHALQRITRGTR
ncbi:MAG TPA: amidohydrolase [Longimicrobiales bacterium]|nr:amidohydrolase [Longimicrobiales bacterium]